MTTRKQPVSPRIIEVLPPPNKALAEAQKTVPRQSFEQLPFWKELENSEQTKLMAESYQLLTARRQYGMALISMGQHLLYIQNMLQGIPNAFKQYCVAFQFSGRSGYRYIEDYERLMDLVKVPVLQVMLTEGFKLQKANRLRPLGEYTEAYVALEMGGEKPPVTMDMDAALRYVKKLKAQHQHLLADPRALGIVRKKVEAKMGAAAKRDTFENLLKEAHHIARNAMKRLPAKRRDEFLAAHVGHLLAYREVQAGQYFDTLAIPEALQQKPGRPKGRTGREQTPKTPKEEASTSTDSLRLFKQESQGVVQLQ